MRWGVRDDASIDHTTTEIVLNQVEYSKQNSKGPFFVSFLGDRYGSRILPPYIDAKEYKLLRRIAMKLGYDVTVMDQWFARDDNAEPSVYYFRSITDILKYYDDDSPENSKAREKDRKKWDDDNDKLLQMFRGAAQYAYDEKLISREAKHIYYKSVTEAEVEEGILHTSNIKDCVMVYERTLQNIDLKDSKAGRFIDMIDGDIDKEAKDLRERLKITKVEPKVGPRELRKFTVDWRPGGIDPEYEPHKQYLSDLSEDFRVRSIRMIDSCIEKGKVKKAGIHHLLYTEVLSHLRFAKMKSEIFCGRDELLEDILQRFTLVFSWKSLGEENEKKENSDTIELVTPSVQMEPDSYRKEMKETQEHLKAIGVHFSSGDLDNDLDSDPNRNMKEEAIMLPPIMTFSYPVVLYGESGSGKTSVMAKLAYKVQEWYPGCVSVIRFMGTSPLSSAIKTTLLSVCAQISIMYGIPPMAPGDLEGDYQYLCKYFTALLWRINTKDKPLVIILDSVDQLSCVDNPHNMKWIPCHLPTNVHMVVSMVPNIHNCLENMLSYFPHCDMFVEIPLLTSDVAEDIITQTCRHKKRRLTRLQTRFIVEKFTSSPYPLYLKLLLDQALMWKSNTVVTDIQVGNSIREAINKIFDGLESKHGVVLIQKFMRALAACRMGISKSEVEDVLSLDDEALQDTYLYHLPPNPEKIRIPFSVLTLLIEDLKEYIVTQKAGHMKILSWYHRHFAEACIERYFPNNCRKATHTLLAEYFEGYWYERVKPLELYKVKKGSFPDAVRNVQSQPIRWKNHYNIRKLYEYPYHLIMSGQFEKYVEDCVCNFDFLYAQIKVLQLGSAFNDLKLAMSTMDEHGDIGTSYSDIETVYNMISLDADCIRKEVNQLATQILSRLGPKYSGSKHIGQLVCGAMTWIKDGDVSVLYPNMCCAPSPGGLVKTTFSAAVKYKGDNFGVNYGHVMCLDEKTDQLTVINKSDTQKADELITYSLSDNGSSTYSKKMLKVYSAIWMYCDNKYVHLVDDTVNKEELYESASYRAVQFPYPQDAITISQSGNLLVFSSVSKIYVCKIGKSIHDLTPMQTLECDGSPVKAVLISPDEKFIVAVIAKEMNVAIFDIKTGLKIHEKKSEEKFFVQEVPKSLIKQVSMITKDNKLIVKSCKAILLVELDTGESAVVQPFDTYDLNVVSVHPAEKFVAVGSSTTFTMSPGPEKQWKVWDTSTKQIVSKAHEHLYNSCGVENLTLFGKDDLFVALTMHYNRPVFLAYLGTLSCPIPEAIPYRQLIGHSDNVLQLLLRSDHSLLITAAEDNRIIVWDVSKITTEFSTKYGQQPDQTKVLHDYETELKEESNTLHFAIGRDDKHVYMGTSGGQLIVHDLDDHTITKKIEIEEKEPINFVLVSKNGSFIITAPKKSHGGKNVTIKIWNSTSYDLVHDLEHRSSQLTCLAEANDILVSGQCGMEAKACVWDIKTGEVLKTFELLYSLYNVAIDSKGRMVVSTFFEFPIVIPVEGENQGGYDMSKMDCLMSSPTCLDISPDDQYALCGSTDGQIRVIQLLGEYKYRMAQKSSVIAAKFSPDGQYIMSTGFKSVYIWNLKDGNLRFKLKKHNDFVVNIQFDALGKYMITSGRDKKIVYWDVSTFISLASFYSHCQVDQIGLTSDGNKVIYVPENVGHIAVLSPNNKLQQVKQKKGVSLKHEVLKAQAMALSFSSQRLVSEPRMSSACSVM
ncbi:hypothetical protein FSP39_015737 [Pinctada imbricata]|uniref:NACHT and WD repeat domain-containing protein 1 n=1 Tax=Pinctada imbricata TaxID=66713 RepID=A0AA88Y0T5_PINIB|nr:hypothetical protein FSP39_015737 [Pinctada imbricata]